MSERSLFQVGGYSSQQTPSSGPGATFLQGLDVFFYCIIFLAFMLKRFRVTGFVGEQAGDPGPCQVYGYCRMIKTTLSDQSMP
jgi:hypothetical protein